MFCSNCGTSNKEDAIMCIKCGNQLPGAAKVVKPLRTHLGLFDPDKYRHYTNVFVFVTWVIYILITLSGAVVGFFAGSASSSNGNSNIFLGIVLALVGGAIGWIIAWFVTLMLKIKIQEMKWRIDIHEHTSNI